MTEYLENVVAVPAVEAKDQHAETLTRVAPEAAEDMLERSPDDWQEQPKGTDLMDTLDARASVAAHDEHLVKGS